MKPGRLRFSLPSPYVSHEPRLGRTRVLSPLFMSINDGSWFGTSHFIERTTQRSSACWPKCGNISLIGMPLCPYCVN